MNTLRTLLWAAALSASAAGQVTAPQLLELTEYPKAPKPVYAAPFDAAVLDAEAGFAVATQIGRIFGSVPVGDYQLDQPERLQKLVAASEAAEVPLMLYTSPYFRCGPKCAGHDDDRLTEDDFCERNWLADHLAKAQGLGVQVVLADQECAKRLTPENVDRVTSMRIDIRSALPSAKLAVYMNAGHTWDWAPAFEVVAGDWRSVRLYETFSVTQTEGNLERAAAKYPNEPIMAIISIGGGYVDEPGRPWAWKGVRTLDEEWRQGNRVVAHPRVTEIWHYPGPYDPRIADYHERLGAFLRGMLGLPMN